MHDEYRCMLKDGCHLLFATKLDPLGCIVWLFIDNVPTVICVIIAKRRQGMLERFKWLNEAGQHR